MLSFDRCLSAQGRTALGALVVSIPAWLASGCTTIQPYDTLEYTRTEAEERVGGDLAADIEVPYEINTEMLEFVTGRVNPSSSDKKRVDQLLDLIFTGIGLEYRLEPTRDAVQTFESAQANCLSFTHLFVGLARSQHLNPFYVEVEDYQRWSYQDGSVVSRGHIVAGMYVDGSLATFDFLPYRPKAYRDFDIIDDLTAMAHHYNNLAAEALMENRLDLAEQQLRIATRLDPDFEKAINNLGVLYMRTGEAEKAIETYEAALPDHPRYVPILSNLASAYQRTGDKVKAEEVMATLEEVDLSNPFFFVYRGTEALDRGDTETALRYMRDALSIDTEIPEVHLGIAKVYMATGQKNKARHHVERALKLDATHPEARRFAQMFDAPPPEEIVLDGGQG